VEKKETPVWEKGNFTLKEAAAYYNIGINRLREMSNKPGCDYVMFVGNKRLIKRKQFDKFLETAYSI
jgi:excisionase family DNA binding protein